MSLGYLWFEALHGEVSMYIWFAVTPCVFFRELSLYIQRPWSRFIGLFGRLLSWKELSYLFNTTWANGLENWLGIVINYTTAEWVLKLVSTFRLACSSHPQDFYLLFFLQTSGNTSLLVLLLFTSETNIFFLLPMKDYFQSKIKWAF